MFHWNKSRGHGFGLHSSLLCTRILTRWKRSVDKDFSPHAYILIYSAIYLCHSKGVIDLIFSPLLAHDLHPFIVAFHPFIVAWFSFSINFTLNDKLNNTLPRNVKRPRLLESYPRSIYVRYGWSVSYPCYQFVLKDRRNAFFRCLWCFWLSPSGPLYHLWWAHPFWQYFSFTTHLFDTLLLAFFSKNAESVLLPLLLLEDIFLRSLGFSSLDGTIYSYFSFCRIFSYPISITFEYWQTIPYFAIYKELIWRGCKFTRKAYWVSSEELPQHLDRNVWKSIP